MSRSAWRIFTTGALMAVKFWKTNLCLFIHNSRFGCPFINKGNLLAFADLWPRKDIYSELNTGQGTPRGKKEKKKGQGARTLKRGERTEEQSTTLLSSPAASLCNLLATSWQIVALFSPLNKPCISWNSREQTRMFVLLYDWILFVPGGVQIEYCCPIGKC